MFFFLWISVQPAITSISSTEWLAFLMEAHDVICEVRTGFPYINVNFFVFIRLTLSVLSNVSKTEI